MGGEVRLRIVEELEREGDADGLVEGVEAFFSGAGGFVELDVERGGFEIAGAGEAPFAIGHAFNEAEFDGVLWFELGDEGADVEVVGVAVFVHEGGGVGVEPVFGGVLAGTGFADVGLGSGGFEGVLPVGVALGVVCCD